MQPKPAQEAGPDIGWGDLFDHFDLVDLDLHTVYGIDFFDATLDRPWPWWRSRIIGLLSVPESRISRFLNV